MFRRTKWLSSGHRKYKNVTGKIFWLLRSQFTKVVKTVFITVAFKVVTFCFSIVYELVAIYVVEDNLPSLLPVDSMR
jgi:cell division protein FtsL